MKLKELREQADWLFGKASTLMSLRQEIAETFYPERRNLRVASAKHATGPYGPAGPAITGVHTEGPSLLKSNGWWYLYYDEYTKGKYGALRTHDFVTWQPFSDSLKAARGMRHGSAFLAPQSVLNGLLALDTTLQKP